MPHGRDALAARFTRAWSANADAPTIAIHLKPWRERSRTGCTPFSRRRAVFLVGSTRYDPQSVIRQWPLQGLRLVPRRAHPHVAVFFGRQDYPSAQVTIGKKNKNVVLFHPSSRVEELEFPPNTELSARTYTEYEEGPEPDYWVSEITSGPKPPATPTPPGPVFAIMPGAQEHFEPRPITLQLDLESLEVRHIEAVSFRTTKHSVRRHRMDGSHLDKF
jgi:hypothetical protein